MKHNQDEWEELTALINIYIVAKGWDVPGILNYLKGCLVKTAKVSGVKKIIFDRHCDAMKKDFDNYSEIKNSDLNWKNGQK